MTGYRPFAIRGHLELGNAIGHNLFANADGIPIQVAVYGPPEYLDDDTWVEVDVVWRPPAEPYSQSLITPLAE